MNEMPFAHVIQWQAIFLQYIREFPVELEFRDQEKAGFGDSNPKPAYAEAKER